MLRKFSFLAAALSLLLVSYAKADITGSAHDFSKFSGGGSWSEGEICKPCHTPHNAIATDLTGRLWNHTITTASYTLHGSSSTATAIGGSIDAGKAGSVNDMDARTRLCLSCHDGTVALDSFGGKTGSTFISSTANLGNDLRNDHPVGLAAAYNEMSGLTWGPSPTDPTKQVLSGHARYKPLATFSGTSANGLRLVALDATTNTTYVDQSGATVTQPKQVVGCITCHDVHNGGASGENGLLRISNGGSKLCLSCHNK